MQKEPDSDDTNTSQSNTKKEEWMGFQAGFYQSKMPSLKDTILLDTGSMTSLFANPNLVQNIHDSNEVMEMASSAGRSPRIWKCVVRFEGNR